MFTSPQRRNHRRSARGVAAERLEPRRLLAAGGLDPTFGTGGKVLTDFPASADDEAAAIAVQADGKYVVAGEVASNGVPQDAAFGLVRYDPDGSLDPTFGDGGRVLVGFDRFAAAESVAITPDGKIIAAGVATVPGQGLQYALVRLNSDGSLDPTFDGDGRRLIEFDGRNAIDPSVAVQADGKVLLAGTPSSSIGALPALVRLNTDGSFDSTFDGDGILTSPASMSGVYAVALDGDRPVLAGNFGYSKFAVARFTPAGAPDMTFDGDGVAVMNFGPSSASAVSVMADGRIVATGTVSVRVTQMTTREIIAVAWLKADGSLDGSTAFSHGTDYLRDSDVLPAADGSVIVAGQKGYFGGTPFLFRLTPSRALDTSFGGGFLQVASSGSAQGPSLAPGPQGSVVVATAGGGFNGSDFLVARYTASGTPDVTFNDTGSVRTDFVAMSNNTPTALAVLPDGRFAVAGNGSHALDDGPLLARYLPDGSLDASFGAGGTVGGTTEADGSIYAVAAQPDGKLLAAGTWTDQHDVRNILAVVMRYNADGTPDATFGDGGRLRFAYSTGQRSTVAAMLLQPDGKILLAGEDAGQFALARLMPSGVLDTSFGSGGTVVTPISTRYPGIARVSSLALGSDGTIVAAGPTIAYSTPGHTFAVARYDAAGRLDASFATRGWKEYQVQGLGYTEDPLKAAILADGRILVGTTLRKTGADKDFVLLRITPWGDAEFGTSPADGGVFLTDFTGGDDVLGDLLVLPDAVIAVGTAGATDGRSDFGVARYSLAGDLDPSLGTGGKVTTDFAGMSDKAVAAALAPDGRLVVAGPALVPLRAPDFGVARYLLSDGAPVPRVVGAHVFYRGAAPTFAAAPDKQPLLPGELPGFRNVTSYVRGINGITLDVANPRGVELTADDFVFTSIYGNAGARTGPRPASVTTQRGVGGADRVTLTWNDFNPRSAAPDQAVANGWLEVTVQPDRLGLTAPYVFRFGNLIGETGDGAAAAIARNGLAVGATDVLATRAAQRPPGGASSRFDFNRDGRVNVLDLAVARDNVGNRLVAPAESLASIPSALTPPARKRRGAYLPLMG